jgi:bifunctional DNase/RNase
MPSDNIEVTVRGVMPTANGCAVFLGNDAKVFVIYVDHAVGNAIQLTLDGIKKERPLTHELIGQIFLGLGVELKQVLINNVNEGTFFARILLHMTNELGQKIVEIDARPSDSMALALQHQRPILVAPEVFAQVEDMSEILERVQRQREEESSGSDDAGQ